MVLFRSHDYIHLGTAGTVVVPMNERASCRERAVERHYYVFFFSILYCVSCYWINGIKGDTDVTHLSRVQCTLEISYNFTLFPTN